MRLVTDTFIWRGDFEDDHALTSLATIYDSGNHVGDHQQVRQQRAEQWRAMEWDDKNCYRESGDG